MKSNNRTNTNNNSTTEDTMYSNPCEINGTCDHETPICEEWADAPFCGGPSMKECAGGAEVPENEVCPGNDTDALGDPNGNDRTQTPDWVNEIHGEQFDGNRDTKKENDYEYSNKGEMREVIENHTTETATPAPAPVDALPMTGINDVLFGGALGLIALGTALVRIVKS